MDGTSSHNVRTTVVGTLEAMWQLDGHAARIQSVRRTPGEVVVSYAGPDCPDLADARQQWPDLTPLWDAVRHELWAALVSPLHHYSSDTRYSR